ncbi:MAG: hypothetical protein RCO49_06665 [Rickettsia endosymbiont of Argas persicus]
MTMPLEELASSLTKAEEDISALHEVLYNKEENNKKEHRLYVYLLPNQTETQEAKNLIYIKSPHKFNKDELETLDIYVHMAKLLNASAE